MALLCNKSHAKWRFFGQYVQCNQPKTNWEKIAQALCGTKYNGFVVHLLSPFGNFGFFPWPLENGKFNLDKKNQKWYDKLKEMLIQVGGRGNNIISLCFFDSYITRFNKRRHPFKHNNKNINWGDGNERALYNPYKGGNPSDQENFTWVFYKTDAADNVLFYEFQDKFMEVFITSVMEICEEVKKMFPNRFKIVYRCHNENSEKFGGDTRVHEIFEDLWKKHAPSFKVGLDLWQADDYMESDASGINLKVALKGNRYLKAKRRLQELHNIDALKIQKIKNFSMQTSSGNILKFDTNIIIFSTDGLKPENNTFVPRAKAVANSNEKKADLKVPSDLTPYVDDDFEKTFNGVLGVMKDINQ